MKVRFSGVRGSVPWATPGSIGHGCNTSCVEVSTDDGRHRLILDAGSGIVALGESLTGEPREVPILLTHYHWDHVQGLPYFVPFYKPGWSPSIHAPALGRVNEAWIETIFQPPFFPVSFGQLPARPDLHMVRSGDISIGGFDIRAQPVNHPNGAFGYRIRGTGGDLVYIPDHELGDRRVDEPLGAFVSGARALILDAHFTPEESPSFVGWGHSNWSDAARFAAANNVGQLWLFHHKPGRSDRQLAKIKEAAREIFPAVDVAAEGDSFDV
jgi:phosphoribosyl 1,2-cyclic phosphodiesterase